MFEVFTSLNETKNIPQPTTVPSRLTYVSLDGSSSLTLPIPAGTGFERETIAISFSFRLKKKRCKFLLLLHLEKTNFGNLQMIFH